MRDYKIGRAAGTCTPHGSCISLAQVSEPVTVRYFGFNRWLLAEAVNE